MTLALYFARRFAVTFVGLAVMLFLIMLFFIAYFLWSMYQEDKGGR